MLELSDINASYGDLQALWGISLRVTEGELVALVGPNGAGKTTTLRVITGLLKPGSGSVTFGGRSLSKDAAHKLGSGSVTFGGRSLSKDAAHKLVGLGLAMVPEGGRVFTSMTVLENLELGAYTPGARKVKDRSMKWVYETFPRLEERKAQRAGTLSGGERQMLAIGRAMMSQPKLLLLDEPSFGLAPIMVQHMFEMIGQINQQGITVLLVEQNVRAALELAQRAYVIENGRIVGQGTGDTLLSFESVRSAYLA
jgi:branched-chain amino acid transport system ATP-binding protein